MDDSKTICTYANGALKVTCISLSTHPEKVVYADPATVVYWGDGTKTVVVCQEGDTYDEREGFLLCCAKKLMGNTGAFNRDMAEHAPERHSARFALGELVSLHGR